MTKRARVSWSEGLLLTPQHLQQLDRYHEERGAELFRAGGPHRYGFSTLDLDPEAIANGRVVVRSASGVTEAGIPFAFPEEDPVPSPRSVEEFFPPEQTALKVHLGLRVHRSGERQVAENGEGPRDVRYLRDAVRSHDEVTGETEREVEICRNNLRILFPSENLGDYDHLPLAEVVRKPEGGYAFREDCVPPCLRMEASPYLLQVTARILELLVARSRSLSDRRQHRGQGVAEFSRDDVAGFWLLGTVNKYIPVLGHFLRERGHHPETVYRTLAAAAGELTTMSDLDVRETPTYDHRDLGSTFSALAERLPRMLREVLPQNYDRIALTARDDQVQVAEIQDDRLLDPAVGWYLGVFANVSQEDLQTRFPDLTKIGPPDQVDFLISQAIRGVELKHVQTLPPALPVRPNFVYFQVIKSGDVWDLVAGARAVAIYVPPELPNYNLELIAVRG